MKEKWNNFTNCCTINNLKRILCCKPRYKDLPDVENNAQYSINNIDDEQFTTNYVEIESHDLNNEEKKS